jgi:hypothetical protein
MESAMITSATTTPQFEIPSEMRAVAARRIEQAKLVFNNCLRATEEAVSVLEEQVEASQVGTQDIGKEAMSFALHNAMSAFEFAQKIIQAKDTAELIRSLAEFFQVLNEQVKDLGDTVTKIAMDSMKGSKKGDLSS